MMPTPYFTLIDTLQRVAALRLRAVSFSIKSHVSRLMRGCGNALSKTTAALYWP
jgi:hypothetical protein